MAIAALWNVPTDPKELDDWTFIHMVHHRDVNDQIFREFGISIEEFALDPLDPHNPGQWEDQHQAMHQATNTVLGISGFDLTGIDWLNPTILSGWIQSNAVEHREWSDILGVG
jgi:hypothetical protein